MVYMRPEAAQIIATTENVISPPVPHLTLLFSSIFNCFSQTRIVSESILLGKLHQVQ